MKRFYPYSLCFIVACLIYFIPDFARPYTQKHYRASYSYNRIDNLEYRDTKAGLYLESYAPDKSQGIINLYTRPLPLKMQIKSACLTPKYILARTDYTWLIIEKNRLSIFPPKDNKYMNDLGRYYQEIIYTNKPPAEDKYPNLTPEDKNLIEVFTSEKEWLQKLKTYNIEKATLLPREEFFASLPNLPEPHEILLRDLPLQLIFIGAFYVWFCFAYVICWWTYVLIISLRDKPKSLDAQAS